MKDDKLLEYERKAYERRKQTRNQRRYWWRRVNWFRVVLHLSVLAWLAVILYFMLTPVKSEEPPEPVKEAAAVPSHKDLYRVAVVAAADVDKPAQEPEMVTYYESPWPLYTDTMLNELALVIYQEAGGDACSDETRQMVGEVVLNRVKDDRFSELLKDVLLQERQFGRLHWTGLVWPERAAMPEEEDAVDRAFACARKLLENQALQLLPPDTVWMAEFEQGAETVLYQDGFYFCR